MLIEGVCGNLLIFSGAAEGMRQIGAPAGVIVLGMRQRIGFKGHGFTAFGRSAAPRKDLPSAVQAGPVLRRSLHAGDEPGWRQEAHLLRVGGQRAESGLRPSSKRGSIAGSASLLRLFFGLRLWLRGGFGRTKQRRHRALEPLSSLFASFVCPLHSASST